MQYQWYPGHMSKAKRQIQDELKLVDVIIELVDARIPYSSKNPDIEKFAGNKPRVLLLNKADLAGERATAAFKKFYEVSIKNELNNFSIISALVATVPRLFFSIAVKRVASFK